MPSQLVTWTGSLHQTFRLLPTTGMSPNLRPFLASDGQTPESVLARLPYDIARARARGASGTAPDPKRYRDGKQVFQTAGLLYEGDDGLVRVTELGSATLRWLDIITDENSILLARHAAYTLSACQLRNPTGSGRKYAPTMNVFPFRYIWKAMLVLDYKISSDELNRAIFKVQDEVGLARAVSEIETARRENDVTLLGSEVITGTGKNDRIIPWMSLASFGWTLFPDKRAGEASGYYELPRNTLQIVREASKMNWKHKDFENTKSYMDYLSRCAALPRDLR